MLTGISSITSKGNQMVMFLLVIHYEFIVLSMVRLFFYIDHVNAQTLSSVEGQQIQIFHACSRQYIVRQC